MEKQNLQKDSSGIQTVGSVLKVIGSWIYRLRKVLMAIPVIFAAIYLARYNMANLPAARVPIPTRMPSQISME